MKKLLSTWLVKGFTRTSYLVSEGFQLYNRHILIARYDDVLQAEYDEYQEYLAHEMRLQLMRQGLKEVALGLAEDVDEDLM